MIENTGMQNMIEKITEIVKEELVTTEREELIRRRKAQAEIHKMEQEKYEINKIKFLGKPHTVRMLNLLRETQKINEVTGYIDIEYGTAYYLLSSYEDIYNKARKYISSDGIKFKNMLSKQDFSTGEKILVKLAANLFNSNNYDIAPIDIIGYLDDELFDVAMSAIMMRRNENLTLGILVNQMALKG